MAVTGYTSLVQLLETRAAEQPSAVAYRFLSDGESPEGSLTFAELDAHARAIGSLLQGLGAEGERVLLLYPPGLPFVAGFLGCLYAGAVAVPAYPPRSVRHLPRLLAIARDARPRVALTTSAVLPRLQAMGAQVPELAALHCLATDALPAQLAGKWQPPLLWPDSLAFLQYTSGSTSLPKGVQVSHGNLLHNEEMIRQAFGHGPESVIVSWLPLYHDMGLIGGVLQPLYLGASCILMSPVSFLQQPVRWLQTITRFRATTSGAPNFAYELCVRKIGEEQRRELDLSSWEVAFNGAEPVRAETMDAFAKAFSPCGFRRDAFYPCYGLAEATLFVTGGEPGRFPVVRRLDTEALERNRAEEGVGTRPARSLVSCGSPWLGQRVKVVDPETGRPLLEHEVGEVWISGPSVAGGYWNRPEETARTFGARLADGSGETFLRTGDLGFLSGGALYLTGRAKDLIILRGRNLYPQDLELTAERSHADLRAGCGAAFSIEVEGEERLVIAQEVERDAEKRWQRGAGSATEVAEAVRRAVAAEHEAAVHAVVLLRAGSVPKTSSGKIQRRACRADFLAGRLEAVEQWTEGDGTAGEAPRTPTEERLERIWAEVLGRERVGVERDLFELGADSLRATQLLARVNEAFGVALMIDSLFGAPSIAELASLLDRTDPAAELPRLERLSRDGGLPLSFAQRRLWFLHQLDPGNPVHNIAASIRLRGRLDVAALAEVFNEIVRRHEALRTGFASPDGEPVQRVLPPVRLPLPVIDLSALERERGPLEIQREPREAQAGPRNVHPGPWNEERGPRNDKWGPLEAARAALARLPFPLETGPFLRAALVRFAEDEHELLLSFHHIASDGGSLAVLVREMGALYEAFASGRPSPLPDLPVQYADFAAWQRRRLDAGALEPGLAYWRGQLGGELPAVELPADRSRPAVLSHRGAHAERLLPARLVERLEALAREGQATRFMALLAGFEVLLHRYTGLDDLVVGTPIDGRNRVELEGLIGVFLNNLVLRTRLDGQPAFRELLARVRRTALDAYAHQEVPFEHLVDELRPERDLSRTPLFQVMFVGQNAPLKRLGIPGLALEPREVDLGTARFDLSLSMGEADGGWLGIWKYSTDLFDAATLERVVGHLESLIAAAVTDPDRPIALLPILSDAERRQVVEVWNDTAAPFPDQATLHGLFEEQARRTPDAVALEYGDLWLTYEDLNRHADRLASLLRGMGVEVDTLAGIAAERSVELVVGLMGILKAGGAYVPLDPSYPRDRLAYMLEDSGVRVLLTQSHLELPASRAALVRLDEEWDGQAAEAATGVRSLPGTLAYCIYTSGSTGRPKGVGIPHRGIVNRLHWMQSVYRLTAEDRVLQKTPFSFDVSVWEFFWPLLTGARLVMAPPGAHQDAARLAELIRRHGITTLHFVPSMLQVFLEQDGLAESCRTVRRVFVSGEALPLDLKERFFARVPGTELHNLYGPTEASVDVTFHACRPGGRAVPIGRPIDNTSILILDRESQPVPVGVPGELHIGGVNLARGYLGRPELTAGRFVPDPFGNGERLYRTGDLAKLRPDGEVEYLGRLDFQVKIRGVRIELGEIEAELSRHPGVREVCVLARPDGGTTRLVAYLVPSHGDLEPAELRAFLRSRLPEALMPSVFVVLPAFPLNPSGKVDRKALPAPEGDRPERDGYEAPRTEMERRLAEMWRDLLGIERVGIHDNFFELGGDSIQGAMFINRLQKELGRIVYVMALFDAPTVASFAEYLAAEYPDAGPRSVRGNLEVEPALEKLRATVSLRLGRTTGGKPEEIEEIETVPPVVFLLSPFRSGSTLLRVMLAGHPRLFAPPELELLAFRTMAERRDAYSGRNRFATEGLLRAVMDLHGCDADRAREIVAGAEGEGLAVSDFYRRLQEWSGGRLVVDKTPSYALDLGTLRRAERMFENPLYIHLVRHPLATIGSYLEAKMDQVYGFPFPPEEQAELVWNLAHRNILAFLEEVPAERRHRLRFEDLVKDPRGSMEAVSRFLGLEMEEAMLDPYQGERMTDGLHAGTRMMGDPKFHQHRGIDASVADRWRQEEGALAPETWSLAAELGYANRVALRPVPRKPGVELPLSFAQQRLWFLDQLKPGSPLYNIPAALRISGPLSVPALEQALREIVRRHEVLRTVFALRDGLPAQVILLEGEPVLSQGDLSGLPDEEREAELLRLAWEEARTPFDLACGPMLRVRLLRLGPTEHAALVTMHHVASDGWSLRVFVRELGALYGAFSQGRPSPLPELPVQYADFAAWQRAWLRGETLEAELSWWRERLAGAPAVLDLPTDRPRPAVPNRRGASRRLRLSQDLASGLERLSQEGQATPFMALLAGLQALLHRYTGSADVPVGTTIAGRNRAEIEGLIGFFVNTLVLRTDLSGSPGFRDLLARVRTAALGAYDHQDFPFERLVEELQPERSLAHTPLFQVMLSFQNLGAVALDLPGLDLRLLELESGTAKFDLTFALRSEADGIGGTVEYSEELLDEATVDRLIGHFERLLGSAVAEADRPVATLPLLADSEWRQVVEVWNDTAAPFPEEISLHGLFEEQVRRTPGAVALEYGDARLTYDGLNRRANRLARHLRRLGVGSDNLVGIAAERSLEMVVGLLGILKAGAAYVPLDPSYPQERLAYMLEDSGVGVLLTQSHLRDGLPASSARVLLLDDPALFAEPLADRNPVPAALPESLAYAIYTSGSTGRPKGTGVPHRGIINRLCWGRSTYELGADDRVLQKTPFGFDVSVWELFWPLVTGARLVMSPPGAHQDPARLTELIREHGITTLHFVPSMLQVFLEQEGLSGSCRSVRQVFASGEALPFELKERFFSRLPGRELHNLYGPTEASVEVTYHACEAGGSRPVVPIGRPVHNTSILILDREDQPVPVGVSGELHIGGVSLARGYLGRPDLTAERFVPNPFGNGERLYRTGDLAKWRDGEVEYLGRLDFQVKIRGVRIELGEIEAALASHPVVREAVVTARDGRLVAYLVASGEPDLRPFLRERLPGAMVPSVFVFLPSLPLNANGKVDRKALPAPEWGGDGFVAPRDEVEQGVAEIWAELLPVERVGALDSFFDLGGHSLLATQAVSRLRDRFGVELPLRRLFEAPSVAALAEVLRREAGVVPVPPLVPVDRGGDLPLSYAQERLWFLDQLEPGSAFYNMPAALRLRGRLSVPVLAQALEEIVRRHEALRTVFSSVDGRPVQTILPVGPFPLPLQEAKEREIGRLAREEAATPFDLGRGPLRARLLWLAEEDHALLLTLHHIAGDGWSLGVLVREVSELYSALVEGRRPELPELPVQYADFACWQRSWLTGEVLEGELGWWRQTLAGAPPVLELPMDRPRPAVQSYRGGSEELRLPAELSESLLALGRQERATPFMTLLAVFEVLLQRYAGRDDVVVGTPVANRSRSEIEDLIGFFVNTLVLRADLSGDPSFRGLLGRVREAALGAYAHQEVPFEKLVEELQPERSLAHTPLFQVMFSLQEAPFKGLELPGLSLSLLDGEAGNAKFDLTLTLTELPGGLHGSIEYSADLFDTSTVRRMAGHLETLLRAAASGRAERLSDLPLLTPSELREVLAHDAALPEAGDLLETIALQAERDPGALALVAPEGTVTYGELVQRVDDLARRLRSQGVGPEVRVGLSLERSVEAVVSLLAVMRAGGAYVPLPPGYPREWMEHVLADSGAALVLTGESLLAELPAEELPRPEPDQAAYVLYTSGSTGRPKGVQVPRRALSHHAAAIVESFGLRPGDRVLQFAALGFDVAAEEIFPTLAAGATLVLWPERGAATAAELQRFIARERLTVLNLPTPYWREWVAEQLREGVGFPSCLRLVVAGSEAVQPADIEAWRRLVADRPVEWRNAYGLTEATITSTTWTLPREGAALQSVPIGRPLPGVRAHVLDRDGGLLPAGVPGELCLGGPGLARGYLGRPDLTAERFVPDPFGAEGGRLYRTGDLVHRLPGGDLEYLGRIDHQVKIRGIRIEPGEIEATLAGHPGIAQAVVLARETATGDRRLVAYVTPAAGHAAGTGELRSYLLGRLPQVMIPSSFAILDALPLLPSGKLDRRALLSLEGEGPRSERPFVAPRTLTEQKLGEIWSGVLGRDRIGIHDDFFELGGHSLLATRVVAHVNRAFQMELPLRLLFERPTLAAMAEGIEEALLRELEGLTDDEATQLLALQNQEELR